VKETKLLENKVQYPKETKMQSKLIVKEAKDDKSK